MNQLKTAAIIGVALFSVLSSAVSAGEPSTPAQSHPLDAVIPWAEIAQQETEKVQDYTAKLIKREQVGGQLQEYQHIQIKVRHRPFSVYLKFIGPSSLAGREVLYVDGRNNGMLLAYDPRGVGKLVGTVALAPDGPIAMWGQRYPLTMIGMKNLGQKLLEQAKWSRQVNLPCEIKWYRGAKINGRSTLGIEVCYSEQHQDLPFAMARVFIDDELKLPIRYEGYSWPETGGGKPVLVEEYTYSCIKLNVGLTDWDFDPQNPHYNLR